MYLLFQALIMGIVEGITEFLPISSTGHLIIVGELINFKGEFATMFEIVIQLGAILAIVFYYREKIFDSLKNLRPGKWGFNLWFKLAIAFLPSAIIGLLLNDYIDTYLFNPFTVSIALIVGAILILVVQSKYGNGKIKEMDKTGIGTAFLIGTAQCLSLFPGMSRSAATIMGGMMVGLSVKAAAEFSFFLAIPTMFAATGYSLLKGGSAMSPIEWAALSVGFITSFIVALLVVDKFITFLAKHSLKSFAYYRLIVGVIMIILAMMGIISVPS